MTGQLNLEITGEPSWIRTSGLLIKSHCGYATEYVFSQFSATESSLKTLLTNPVV
jgi:hypothetical protein